MHASLTDYANLVLLSEHEEQGIVICEAMFCGLGIVCSESPARGLDTTLPWITLIPEDKIRDVAYVESEIARNRTVALQYRSEIRDYGMKHYSSGAQVDALYFNQSSP
jgi:glycosyltransferase involved in cell wall biosynthesis